MNYISYYFLIFEFLSIDDISSFDIAYTNKKFRKDILLFFQNLKIDTKKDANKNADYFIDRQFYKYINCRQISMTSHVIFNNKLTYILENTYNTNCVEYLKIFEQNLNIEQLTYIFSRFRNLRTLSFGSNMDNEYNNELHYEMYPECFNYIKLINFIDNNYKFSIEDTLIEYLYLVCTNLPYEICYQIILASKKLKKISIRTNNNGFFDLILIILEIRSIEEIEIYDNTIINEFNFNKIIDIIDKLLMMNLPILKLKFDVEDISGGNNHLYQTIITINTKKIKIRFVLQYVINSIEVGLLLDKCQYLRELSVIEDFNGNIPEYLYLFNIDLTFPNTLEVINICSFDEEIIFNIIDRIKTIKKINIDFIFYDEIEILKIIEKDNKNIEFNINIHL